MHGLQSYPVSERILYLLARMLYRTELAHSNSMKEALSDGQRFDSHRRGNLGRTLTAAAKFGVEIRDQTLVDFGCSNGALTAGYVEHGARHVVGVDIDRVAIERATAAYSADKLSFCVSDAALVGLPDAFADVIICYDVFEHVSRPAAILDEWHRLLKPGGKVLIGTWGWRHPYAPHLWSTMPVPWAHVVFSERTLLRTCRRVYHSAWYVPTMHDLDASGSKKCDKYQGEEISHDYLNKLLIRDFVKLFEKSRFEFQAYPQPFGSRLARWTRVFLHAPGIREFVTGYIWFVLQKR
jgi:SAM-dependent methyltransferase